MIPDNPTTTGAYGSFTLPNRETTYWVTQSSNSACAYICIRTTDGPIAAKLSHIDTERPRIEFNDAWRPNPPEWKEDIAREALLVIAAATSQTQQ